MPVVTTKTVPGSPTVWPVAASVTVIGPDVANGGTEVCNRVPALPTVAPGAMVPLNCTRSPATKPVPVMVTAVPTGPDGGENPVIESAAGLAANAAFDTPVAASITPAATARTNVRARSVRISASSTGE